MTSSILSRLEEEITLHMEHSAIMIEKIFMTPPLFRELMIDMQSCMRYTSAMPTNSIPDKCLLHMAWGVVELKVSNKYGDIAFQTETGEIVHSLDEAINRILLGY